jgi:hypothetical protein
MHAYGILLSLHLNGNSPILAGVMHENSQDLRHELGEVNLELSPKSNSNVLHQKT